MAGKGLKSLNEAMNALSIASKSCRALPMRQSSILPCRRSMASVATPPAANITRSVSEPWQPSMSTNTTANLDNIARAGKVLTHDSVTNVPVTVYSFPELEPRSLESYSARHLHLPLRRDILHLAVIYEGDSTRRGMASTKTRYEVHGSHKKMSPQKGTGNARRGTRQSPLMKGGGKTFGPKPRDFSTKLNKKVYDLAWRTALSYRYKRGELIVTEDGLDLPLPNDFLWLAGGGKLSRELEDGYVRKWVHEFMTSLNWGKEAGRTTFITGDKRPNLFTGFELAGAEGRALELWDVDVKDLLETGRIVIERSALKEMIEDHQSDLVTRVAVQGLRQKGPNLGEVLVRAPRY
ncbi:60S ribosomal protein L4, mitochondrial precursor [Neurospora crassa]|uniref:Large ribosomal subunit protein uL4m n=2 Tax=Neurospora crassa TaxID=5141 RepID=Q6MW05_NEUCS|nr:60S ribosomal protein L4 [Neurospora crassa OR74A]ESA42616.1 60S ribosomal protein L4 [Neurospora crassa OR74A]KHE83652.1 60S ribosomal protein L4, mitochondrial precursor [Neurospora crassa]CAE76146.1 related to ribosomal protein YML6, mitochondrial [Neurospora crassa]|eukprot:XP_011394548.1 60S ribosomal protein L4 [Neurospora crassa OR74A]